MSPKGVAGRLFPSCNPRAAPPLRNTPPATHTPRHTPPATHHRQIACVSFGSTRDFLLREVSAKGAGSKPTGRRLCVQLAHGDVLVMRGATQDHWQHSVPKRTRVDAPRVSMTYRRVVAPEGPVGGPRR